MDPNQYQTQAPDPYTYGPSTTTLDPGVVMGIVIVYLVVILAITAALVAGMWKMFQKANKPGWAAIVPIYNVVVMCEISGAPLWWIILLFVPFVNIVFSIMLYVYFVKSYGKDTGMIILSILFPYVMYPIFGFSKSTRYVGPAYSTTGGSGVPPQPATYGQQPYATPPQPPAAPPAPPLLPPTPPVVPPSVPPQAPNDQS